MASGNRVCGSRWPIRASHEPGIFRVGRGVGGCEFDIVDSACGDGFWTTGMESTSGGPRTELGDVSWNGSESFDVAAEFRHRLHEGLRVGM